MKMKNTKTTNPLRYWDTNIKVELLESANIQKELKIDFLVIAGDAGEANEIGKKFVMDNIGKEGLLNNYKMGTVKARSLMSKVKAVIDRSLLNDGKE